MGQVTIYLDSETERKMEKIVTKRRISKSKWIAGKRGKARETFEGWSKKKKLELIHQALSRSQ